MLRRQVAQSRTQQCVVAWAIALPQASQGLSFHSNLSPLTDKLVFPNGWGKLPLGNPSAYMPFVFQPTRFLLQSLQPPPATELTPITNAAQGNLSKLRSAVAAAEVDVLELRHIIKCLEWSIGKNRNLTHDEYKVLEKGVDAGVNLSYVRDMTTLSPFSKEKAERKIKEAKRKMEKAKRKMEKAEQKIKEAERKIKEADSYGTEESVGRVLQQSANFTMTCLASGRASDMENYATYIKGCVDNIVADGASQLSTSCVLRGASGVGKTFATLALTSALRQLDVKYFPIALYCGFNSVCQLTRHEESRLRAGDEMSLRSIVLRRLLLQLNHLAAPHVPVDTSLWDEATGLQRMPVPSHELRWADCHVYFQNNATPMGLIEPLLEKISTKVGQPLVFFPIVDEGQFLDRICPKSDKGQHQGARWALRLLRNIQTSMKGKHRVLGIMTGTNPEVTVDYTEGRNAVYAQPLHDHAGFRKIVAGLLTPPTLEPSQIARVAATFYPIARDIGQFARGNVLSCDFNKLGENERAVILILASDIGCYVHLRWTFDVPAVIDDGVPFDTTGDTNRFDSFRPVLGIRHIAAVAVNLGALPCKVDLAEYSLHSTYDAFEDASWFCLSMLLVLRNYQLPHKHADALNMAKAHIHKDVLDWLLVESEVSMYHIVQRPEDAKLVYFPSSTHGGGHKRALGVVGKDTPALHRDFDLSELRKVGNTVFLACGGDAPVDLIMVTLTKLGDKASKVKPSIQIRLFDAKLITSKVTTASLKPMFARFLLVRAFLEHHLSSEYELTFLPFAIVTADNLSKSSVQLSSSKIIVISPTTCDFPSITEWWFAWAPSKSKS